ncbi:MAG: macro domain-containing protein [Oscillospiraceae bacterium]|nr:macro domain-containing protein [Oscillospiraceae bacterium]
MPFRIIRNDILNTKADAVVNTVNSYPIVGRGVDYAIHRAAGPELLKAREEIGIIEKGTAVSTPAFGLEQSGIAKYIIHTAGPQWEGGTCGEKEILKSCYLRSLRLASELGCASASFPLISAGTYGFPRGEAISIAISAFTEFLSENDMDIYLLVFGEESLSSAREISGYVESYIDNNYVLRKNLENYGHRNGPIASGREFAGGRKKQSLRKENSEPVAYSSSLPSELPISAEESCINEAAEEKKLRRPSPAIPKAEKPSSKIPAPEKGSARLKKSIFGRKSKTEEKAYSSAGDESLEEKLRRLDRGFSETLLSMIDASGKSDPEVYRKANIDRKLFSKIKNDPHYKPSKQTVIAFAMALELSIEETESFLALAGFALSPASAADIIVEHFIRSGNYNIIELNVVLFDFDQQPIGSF